MNISNELQKALDKIGKALNLSEKEKDEVLIEVIKEKTNK